MRISGSNIKANRKRYPKLSVIIPAYNEEKTIKTVVKELKDVLERRNLSYEIVIINDGSTDLTKEEIIKTGERLIDLKENYGKGIALTIGFMASKGANILTIDSDGSHRKEDIELLIKTYFNHNVHMLIGSRFSFKPLIRFTSATNILGNRILNFLLFVISGKYVTDSQSGLRIFTRSILSFFKISSRGYEIESELTAKSLGLGFEVSEVPIMCKPRIFGSSNLNFIKDGFQNAKTLVISYFSARREFGRRKLGC